MTSKRPRGVLRPTVPPPSEWRQELQVTLEIEDPLGTVLWHSLRDVNLWSGTPQRQRSQLASSEAEAQRLAALDSVNRSATESKQVYEPIRALIAVLAFPDVVDASVLSSACWRISQWAEERFALGTALAYALAAVRLRENLIDDQKVAHRVGKLLRERGHPHESELWLEWAMATARAAKDYETQTSALLSLGYLCGLRGNYPSAVRYHLRCHRLAKRRSLRRMEAMSLHDLFADHLEMGRVRTALKYARQAFEAYEKWYPVMLPRLAHDLAVLWMDQGEFEYAFRTLKVTFDLLPSSIRAMAAANLVRASGAVGDGGAYEKYWSYALVELEKATSFEKRAHAMMNLAAGAASMGDWERAEEMARAATALAEDLEENRVLIELESQIAALRSDKSLHFHEERIPLAADALANDLIQYLERRAGSPEGSHLSP